jgi:hypothetical protein
MPSGWSKNGQRGAKKQPEMAAALNAVIAPNPITTCDPVNEDAQVVGLPANTVFNFFHRLIRPRGALQYVSLFKD